MGRLRPLLAALILAACGGGGGGGAPPVANAPVSVVAEVDPAHGSTSVPEGQAITIRFSTPMDPDSLEGGTLLLAFAGSTSPVDVDLAVSLTKTTAVLTPRSPLEADRTYQVRLSALAARADGRPIGRSWYAEFRTGAAGPPPPPPPPPVTGTVSGTGALETGRSGHAAVRLPDGRVAVFGGFATSGSVTGSIETWDPATGLWTTAAAVLGVPRARLTATVLGDGTVLLAGGEDASTTDVGLGTWEIWDPAADVIAAAGSLVERRTRHRAVLLGDGAVLLAGGSRTDVSGGPNFSRATAERFDPVARLPAATGSMVVPRAGHEATLLADGRVLVTGGHGSIAAAEFYDPVAGTFSGAGTMTRARRDHTATRLGDGSVLVAGGGSATGERWIPSTGQWFATQNLGDVRSLHTASPVSGGRVLVAGGEKVTGGGSTLFHVTMDAFLPGSGTFVFPSLQTRVPRSGHTATVLGDGSVLLVGGKNSVLGLPAMRSCDRVTVD